MAKFVFEKGARAPFVSFNHNQETSSLPPEEADKISSWCEQTLIKVCSRFELGK